MSSGITDEFGDEFAIATEPINDLIWVTEPINDLIWVRLVIRAREGQELYAELYRLAIDQLGKPYPPDSQISNLMRALGSVGLDEA